MYYGSRSYRNGLGLIQYIHYAFYYCSSKINTNKCKLLCTINGVSVSTIIGEVIDNQVHIGHDTCRKQLSQENLFLGL